MSESIRSVILSHTLFKEAILAFHPKEGANYYSQLSISKVNPNQQKESHADNRLYGYILLDFDLSSDWELPGGVIIERSVIINHGVHDQIGQECVQSFISPVLLPHWVYSHNGHLFLQGLAAVVSFATCRSVYAPRSSIGNIGAEKLIPLDKFIADNSSDLFANIKNVKVIIKTPAGNTWGRFLKFHPRPKEMQSVFAPHLGIQLEAGSEFLVVNLDNEFNFVGIQQTPIYDQATDEIFVVQRDGLRELAILHPIVVRGVGPTWSIHKDILEIWKQKLSVVMLNLWRLPYKIKENRKTGEIKFDYKKCMQAIRMIQLAHHNYEEDFDLSFSMLVSAIESVAQIAMPKPAKHELYSKWEESTMEDPELRKLFECYCKLQANDNRLNERFADFILKYFPVEQWYNIYDYEILQNGLNPSWESPEEQLRRQMESSPHHFTPDQLREIIKKTYSYRSNFFHRGESAPHRNPTQNPWQRFFEEQFNINLFESLQGKLQKDKRGLSDDIVTYPYTLTFGKGKTPKTVSLTELEVFGTRRFLINRDLMAEIATNSISNYLNEQSTV